MQFVFIVNLSLRYNITINNIILFKFQLLSSTSLPKQRTRIFVNSWMVSMFLKRQLLFQLKNIENIFKRRKNNCRQFLSLTLIFNNVTKNCVVYLLVFLTIYLSSRREGIRLEKKKSQNARFFSILVEPMIYIKR